MKIAVCFFGQIRTGLHASANLKNYFGALYPSIDFFAHHWDKNDIRIPLNLKLVTTSPAAVSCDSDTIQKFIDCYNILTTRADNQTEFYTKVTKEFGYTGDLIHMWYSIDQVLQQKKQHELSNDFVYDIVLLIRPDAIFPKNRRLHTDIAEHLSLTTVDEPIISNINLFADTYFLGKSEAINKLSDFFNWAEFYGKHFWPMAKLTEFCKEFHVKLIALRDNRTTILRHPYEYFDVLEEYWLINAVNAFIYEDINYAKNGGLRSSYQNLNDPKWTYAYNDSIKTIFTEPSAASNYLE